jgi:hypothetical protein
MNEAEIKIAQKVLPRDWTPLLDVVLGVGAFFKRDLDLVMINRYAHEGLLELRLVRPDGTMTRFSKEDCAHLTISAPFPRAEGVCVEPYQAGQYLGRLAESISPATTTSPVDRPMAPAEESMLEPAPTLSTELPRVEPVAELASVASAELLGALNPGASPVEPPRRSRKKKRSRKKTTYQGAQRQTKKRVKRQGPDRFGESDRALFSEMTKLMKDEQLSVEEAAGRLGALDKIKGRGNADSRKHRLAKRYRDERGEPKTP